MIITYYSYLNFFRQVNANIKIFLFYSRKLNFSLFAERNDGIIVHTRIDDNRWNISAANEIDTSERKRNTDESHKMRKNQAAVKL